MSSTAIIDTIIGTLSKIAFFLSVLDKDHGAGEDMFVFAGCEGANPALYQDPQDLSEPEDHPLIFHSATVSKLN